MAESKEIVWETISWDSKSFRASLEAQPNKIAERCTEAVSFESLTLRIIELARDTMSGASFIMVLRINLSVFILSLSLKGLY